MDILKEEQTGEDEVEMKPGFNGRLEETKCEAGTERTDRQRAR